jgi:hypothetical protein
MRRVLLGVKVRGSKGPARGGTGSGGTGRAGGGVGGMVGGGKGWRRCGTANVCAD